MNYIKIFRGADDVVENEVNNYLKEVASAGHRVVTTHSRMREEQTWVLVVISDGNLKNEKKGRKYSR